MMCCPLHSPPQPLPPPFLSSPRPPLLIFAVPCCVFHAPSGVTPSMSHYLPLFMSFFLISLEFFVAHNSLHVTPFRPSLLNSVPDIFFASSYFADHRSHLMKAFDLIKMFPFTFIILVSYVPSRPLIIISVFSAFPHKSCSFYLFISLCCWSSLLSAMIIKSSACNNTHSSPEWPTGLAHPSQ